jgi:uncharacterized protein with HEPN domain
VPSDVRDLAYLHTTREALAKVERQVEGVDYERFLTDLHVADAVAMQLAVVGEAAGKLTPARRDSYPDIDWRKIMGLRHLITHEYEKLDPARLWDVAINHAPKLHADLPGPG